MFAPAPLHKTCRLLSLILLTSLVCGCGGGVATSTEPAVKTSLRRLAVLAGQYSAANKGQSASDVAALKKFAAGLPKERQEALKIDPADLDSLFVSPRDKEPYVLRSPRAAGPPTGPQNSAPVIAYEKKGEGGRRWVAHSNTNVQEVDDDEFRKLVPD